MRSLDADAQSIGKQKAAREALDKTPMNLTLSQPVIPKENILLIQGRYDLLVEPEQTEELWQSWGHPASGGYGTTRRHLLWVRAGLDWACPSLAGPQARKILIMDWQYTRLASQHVRHQHVVEGHGRWYPLSWRVLRGDVWLWTIYELIIQPRHL